MNANEEDLHVKTAMFHSIMTAAHAALKSAVLINGGGAVATLAYVGSLVQNGKATFWFGLALGCFALGVLLTGLASGFAYVTQSKYAAVNDSAPSDFIQNKRILE